jgi:aromatic-amino-acid transaminase
LVATVLNDASLRTLWMEEVGDMRQRIAAMRAGLRRLLEAKVPQQSWEYLTRQKGMFSYTGIPPEKVDALRNEHGIYLVRSGRLCVTGLTNATLEAVARGIAETSGA